MRRLGCLFDKTQAPGQLALGVIGHVSLQELAGSIKASECPDKGDPHQTRSVILGTATAAIGSGSTMPWFVFV